jgi:hypothetical protein
VTVELQRPLHQDAVVVVEPSPRSEVVVVARARTLVGDAERERAAVGGLSPVPKRKELPVRVASTSLELVVRQERSDAVPLEFDPQVASPWMLDGQVDRDAFDDKVGRTELRRFRLDPVLGAVEVEQRSAARRRRHERDLGAQGRPGLRRRGRGQRVH